MAIPTPTRQPIFEQRAQERAFNFQETQANYKNIIALRQEDRVNITQKIQDSFRKEINPLLIGQQELINTKKTLENTRFGDETPHIVKGLKNANIITDDQIQVLEATQGSRKTLIGQAAEQSIIRTGTDVINQDISALQREEAERFKKFDQRMLDMQMGTGFFGDEDGKATADKPGLLALNYDTIYQSWVDSDFYRKHYKSMSEIEQKLMTQRYNNNYNKMQRELESNRKMKYKDALDVMLNKGK